MTKVNVTINGQSIEAQAGQTVLEVAESAGIKIPTLCHHPALEPIGACRYCLGTVGVPLMHRQLAPEEVASTTPTHRVADLLSPSELRSRLFWGRLQRRLRFVPRTLWRRLHGLPLRRVRHGETPRVRVRPRG